MSIVNHPGLYTDLYELTMAQGYFLSGRYERPACFDYFFRKLPFEGGYVVFAGLYDVLEILQDFRFETVDVRYLQSLGFNEKFLAYLKEFRFHGSVISVREGEIVFPHEPVLRVEGTVLETQIIETIVLNVLNFESLIATKASRLKHAAGNRTVVDFGLRRAQGLGGIHASKAAVIGGAESTSNVYSAYLFGLKSSGTMAHSWVESFDDELEAFRTFARLFPDTSVFLVDTYNTLDSGVPNAIRVAHEMKQAGHTLKGIRLDSGDLAYLSKQARAQLDQAGYEEVKIIASNQLDEYIIKSLLEQGAPIDIFGVGTNLAVGRDDAALDGVYKLSMYDEAPRLKISENVEKILLPGVKKVYRYYNPADQFFADAVVCLHEREVDQIVHPFQPVKRLQLNGLRKEELMCEAMKDGKIVMDKQTPYQIRDYVQTRLSLLPEEHKRFENPHVYKVGVSTELMMLRDRILQSRSGIPQGSSSSKI